MRTIAIGVLALTLLGISACKKAPETMQMEQGAMQQMHGMETPQGEAPPLPEGVIEAGNKTCPVSGMAVNGVDFVIYEGKRYGLCCADCREAFLKDPEAYIKKLQERGDIK